MSNRTKDQIKTFNKILKSFPIDDLAPGYYTVLRILADCVLETRHEATGASVVVQLPERYTNAIQTNHIVCLWINVSPDCVAWGGHIHPKSRT